MNDLNAACFLSAVRTGNLSVTARELYITQQAVSRNIQKLEEELGFELFSRRNNVFSLTGAGEEYFRWLTSLNQRLAQAEQLFYKKRRMSQGVLCIGWCTRCGLPPGTEQALELFRQEIPQLRLEFREGRDEDIAAFLESGLIDAAITPVHGSACAAESVTLTRLPLYAMTAGCPIEDCGVCLTDSQDLGMTELAGLGLSGIKSIEQLPNVVSVFATLRRGGCCTVSTENAVTRQCPGLRLFPLSASVEICLYLPSGGESGPARSLYNFFRERGAGE